MLGIIKGILGLNKAGDAGSARRRVLVVDDNPTDLALIKNTIRKMGHEVLTAVNGREGFEAAKSERPDLILSDCRMPEMDGVAMCKLLKADEATKDIPIVFLTGADTPGTVVECFDMGADNYMCKPIKPRLLASQIQAIFRECLTS